MDEHNSIEPYTSAEGFQERRLSSTLGPYEGIEVSGVPDLKTYWQIIRNRRRIVLGVFLVVLVGVGIGTLVQKPMYRASGLLDIGKESPEVVPVDSLVKLDNVSDVYLQTQFGILKSVTLAGRVINQLHLDKVEEFNPPTYWWSPSRRMRSGPPSPAEVFQGILQRFQEQLIVEVAQGSRLVTVSFDSQDPQLAAQVINSLFSSYIETRLETGQRTTGSLSKHVESTKAELARSEKELRQYARSKGLLFLEDGKGNAENIVNGRLRQLQEELTKAQASRYEKESLYQLVLKGDYGSLPGVQDNKLMQDLTVRLADLKRDYAQLQATFTPDYPKVKQVKSQVDELEAMLARERERAAERISNDYHAAVQREKLLRQAFQEQEGVANAVAERSGRYQILKRDVETNQQLYEVLQQKLKEAGVSATLKASSVGIVDMAIPPATPDHPKLALNLALAIMVGLGLGVGVAFLQEYLDTSLKSSEEVSRFLDVPALAMIPSIESLNGHRLPAQSVFDVRRLLPVRFHKPTPPPQSQWYRIDRGGQQHSALVEAFGVLRTSVLLSAAESPPRSLLVSSALPGEGKTTISVNLAISLAQLGQHVLLIDADMRRSCVHKALSLENQTGLVNYLTGERDWRSTVQPTLVPGLEVITRGSRAESPAKLLSSRRMQKLIRNASGIYNFVVVDAPALLINAADARLLAPIVDGVVLVVRSGTTPRDMVQSARAQVPNVIGVILNSLDVGLLRDYYRNYYSEEDQPLGASDEGRVGEAV